MFKREEEGLLRTEDSYLRDALLAGTEPDISFGVKGESIFNGPGGLGEHFHFVNNIGIDLMHTVNEGIIPNLMEAVIKRMHRDNNNDFKIKILEQRVKNFDYGVRVENKPRKIFNVASIQKMKFKLTASETKTFLYNFFLIVGDFVPLDSLERRAIINLQHLVRLVYKKKFDLKVDPNRIAVCVENYINHCIKLACPVTPKSHLLVHLPNHIEKLGVPEDISTDRFEGKNAQVKQKTNTNNKLNLLETLTVKSQLVLAESINSGFKTGIEFSNLFLGVHNPLTNTNKLFLRTK